ncbi:MAG: hypothetical protein ACLPNY_06790 [Roseiarcus sp.]
MKSAVTILGAALAFATAAFADPPPESDQIAQQKMIGLSRHHVRLCLGRPDRRAAIGSTDIWTYRSGRAEVPGLFLAPGVNGMASWFVHDPDCAVVVIMTNGAVSQITYRAPDGGPLPLGELCGFAVENCVAP